MDYKSAWDEHIKKYPTLQGVGYSGLGEGYNRWLYRVKRHVVRRLIRSLPVDESSIDILDVGSGVGFYIGLWKELGATSVTGSDIAPYAVSLLERRYPDYEFRELDIGDGLQGRALPEDHFDVITAIDVLYHIVDDDRYVQAFRNLSRLLKPGGYLVFSENFLHGTTLRESAQVFRTHEFIEGRLHENGLIDRERKPLLVLLNPPVDSSNKILRFWWRCWSKMVRSAEWFGFLSGMFLFPIELCLTELLGESPTTEVMVAQKKTGET